MLSFRKFLNLKILVFLVINLFFVRYATANNFNAIKTGLELTGDKAGYSDSLKNITPVSVTARVINASLAWVGVLFLVLIIYGGLTWMTAQGNDQKIERAKTIIIGSIIGLILIISAFVVSTFIFKKLGPFS